MFRFNSNNTQKLQQSYSFVFAFEHNFGLQTFWKSRKMGIQNSECSVLLIAIASLL